MARFTTSDGLSLYYSDEGTGLPLLCLAGLTRDGRDFDFVAPHLTGLRLIRLDYRGRGRSHWGKSATYTVAVEARDALELLDHLRIERAAILGTSRGGLIAMLLAATAKSRLLGVALNDIGPEIAPEGLEVIKGYLGKTPPWTTLQEAIKARRGAMSGFVNLPVGRWEEEARRLYRETPDGLQLPYDPSLREAVLGDGAQPVPDLWPLFDALEDLPLCLIRGANSDLLRAETFSKMRRRRPDAIYAQVADRGHIPFLDEPDALLALWAWLAKLCVY